MKKRIAFLIVLMIFLFILFAFLYTIGFFNLFETEFIKKVEGLNFTKFGKLFSIFYLLILTIFLILVTAIMYRLVISLKHDNIQLTSLNIDDLSIKEQVDQSIGTSFEKLVSSLDKNIQAIQEYTQTIDTDLKNIDKTKLEETFQENIEKLYQDFSHMINDLIQSTSVSELFEKILYWGVSFSNSKRGSFMIINKSKELYIYKTIGWNNEEKQKINDIRIPLGTSISGKVAAENKRIFVTNIENYEDYDFKYKDHYETKSFISMPIFGIKKVVGVLNLTENKQGLYSINDLEILNIITRLSSKIFELIQIKKKLTIKESS